MNTFDLAKGPRFERVRELFTEMQDAGALLRPAPDRGMSTKRVSASMLYAAARNGESEAIEGVLSARRGARGFYRQVVADTARFALPQARAASSGLAPARHGEGCHIRIEQSRAEPDQYFVLVELARTAFSAPAPTSLIVCDEDDNCRRFPLPAAREGIAQIITDGDSDLMRLISDPASKVYLR
ncbi:MAG: hypothetical protein ACYCZX_00055 [Rhodospirillaceae bacterium]